jgi:hypothetical protein
MVEINKAVLSEAFQERLRGRRLVAAAFTTFRFDPSFFETEVLPVFLDLPLSHAAKVKLVQLEDALRSVEGGIAVYYDHHGLVADGGSAKLDVRRIPIRHSPAIFHPKNVLALVEESEPNDDGARPKALLCACLSANLTRAGWWENVEVAHIEELEEGGRSNLRDSLLEYVDGLVRVAEQTRVNDEQRQKHPTLAAIRSFLRETTARDRRSADGRLHTHFDGGDSRLVEFITEATGSSLKGMNLEVISPYFDERGESRPLEELMQAFEPKAVRVFLPQNDRGEGLCSGELFAWVKGLPDVNWGGLPKDLLRMGAGAAVKERVVHAKVYRFFEPRRGGRQVLYIGSRNLTQPGCGPAGKGNREAGFLVEATSTARPDWWLSGEAPPCTVFAPRSETEGTASEGGTLLSIRYWWDSERAEASWAGRETSPRLRLEHAGVTVVEVDDVAPGQWTPLDADAGLRLKQALVSTSLLQVHGEGTGPGYLLVQEEGMSHKPPLLFELSAADILQYWSLLTQEQRAAFIEAHVPVAGDDDPLISRGTTLPTASTLFDRFAGVFHAFECLRERVREALEQGKLREAEYRLFGKKYDSLGTLVDRVLSDTAAGKGDAVEHYLVALCAKQLLRETSRDFPDYWKEHRDDASRLNGQLEAAAQIRQSLAGTQPEMPAFLDWFDDWFLKRAEALPMQEGET